MFPLRNSFYQIGRASARMSHDDSNHSTGYTSEGPNARVSVRISLRPKFGKADLKSRYKVEKYNLSDGFTMGPALQPLVPKDTPEFVEHGENYVERVMRALYHFKQCSLVGPSGSGKTHLVYLVAELAGLPLWEINCGLQTSVYDLFGRFVGLGKDNWVDGQIVSWCRYGGILYLDEANMMRQDIATRLNPLLDTRGHLVLTERDNEVIPRHSNGYVIISMNPYSAEFAGTKPLNAAFRRRMSVWIDFDYLSVGNRVSPEEVEMVSRMARVDAATAEKIVRVAGETRRQYKAGDLPYAPSVGDLVNWATLVADGLSAARAAEETIIALTSDDVEVQNSVRRVVKMVLGDGKEGTK